MKKFMIFSLMVTMVLGLTISAQASQIINNAPSDEVNLWDIVNGWTGLSLTQNDFQNATVFGILPAGNYSLMNYASYANFSQTLAVPGNTNLIAPDVTSGSTNVNVATTIPFSEMATFAFTDLAGTLATPKSTVFADNNPLGPQSNGFIFDLFALSGNNSAFLNQYVVAFEDGGGNQPLGDSDYNDMVARLSGPAVVPLPGSVLLLGSGLVGLGAWRRIRKG
jgi:hypothetical protein